MLLLNKRLFAIVLFLVSFTTACETIDVFEKNVSIPNYEWSNSFQPEIAFEISDTTALYNTYVVLRHTDAYRYKNIYLNIYMQVPGEAVRKERFELQLATDDKGWLGSGMDDIFEHRIPIFTAKFPKAGLYKYKLEQIMREEPLQYVMNVGIRVEKVKE
jgi:gliding motility-associated lipoprotein GldH